MPLFPSTYKIRLFGLNSRKIKMFSFNSRVKIVWKVVAKDVKFVILDILVCKNAQLLGHTKSGEWSYLFADTKKILLDIAGLKWQNICLFLDKKIFLNFNWISWQIGCTIHISFENINLSNFFSFLVLTDVLLYHLKIYIV